MKKIRIAVATYTNTKPFLYGLQHSSINEYADIIMDNPKGCSNRLISGDVDLGIVPIRTLLEMKHYNIISKYCIGTKLAVDSVFIFSQVPIEEAKTLRLDQESKTSNGLARILLKYYWKRDIEIVESDSSDTFVLIGDRTFGRKKDYPYHYDLSEYWNKMTNMPFAFAAWVANKELSDTFVESFNQAMKIGMDNIDKIIPDLPLLENFDYEHYLKENLDFNLDENKRQAIKKYLELYQTL